MGKVKPQSQGDEKQKHKTHKTLREKLRKKREKEKELMKEKKEKKKNYNPQEKKKEFFEKHFSINTAKEKKEFKYKKIKKYIQKFINIYQDDLEDFFELFKELDEGGFIDIAGLQNKKLLKLLSKMFKYLPLTLNHTKTSEGEQVLQYRKNKTSSLNLESIVRNLVSEAIQFYMENGTDIQKERSEGDNDSSGEENNDKNKKKTKQINIKPKNEEESIFTLPKQKIQQQHQVTGFGPSISADQRQKIAKLFEQQLKELEVEKENQQRKQDDQFEKIFSKATTASKLIERRPKKEIKSALEDVPDHLLAEGSARIGQKVTMNDQEIQQYDKQHRPKKLIDQHKEIMAINRGQDPSNPNQKIRRPFDRERDVVNSMSRMRNAGMQNSVFFNFKQKMSVPKKSNNFL